MPHIDRRGFLSAALLGAGAVGLPALAGCGEDEPKRNLRLSLVGDSPLVDPRLANALASFTDRHGRDVDVDVRTLELGESPWDDLEQHRQRVAGSLAGDSPPDLVKLSGDYLSHASDGLLLPLDDYVPAPLALADLPEQLVDSRRVGGALYGVPVDLITQAASVNLDVLREAGMEPPEDDLTWSEFFDLCVLISARTSSDSYGSYNPMLGESEALLGHWLRQRGQQLYGVDGRLGYGPAELTEWLTYWLDLTAAGGCPDRAAVATATPCFGFGDTISYQWAARDRRHPIGIAPYPRGDDPDSLPGHYFSSTSVLAVAAGSDAPDDAVALAATLALEPGTAAPLFHPDLWYGAPASSALRQALRSTAETPPEYLTASEYVSAMEFRVGDAPPLPPPAARGIGTALHDRLVSAADGTMSVDDAVDSFFTEATALLG